MATSAAAVSIQSIRAGILASAQPVCQPIGSPSVLTNPSPLAPILMNFTPRNTGLLRKIVLPVSVTFTTPAGCTLTRAPFGPANIFSNVTFTDLNNLQRINTSGRHLAWLASVKRNRVAGAAVSTDNTLGFGSNYGQGIINCPATVAAGATQTINMMWEVPVSYQDQDFRGAIWLGTTQASVTLACTLNPGMFVATGQNLRNAVYSYTGGTPPTITSVVANPYMMYWDQLPVGSDGLPLLPLSDMGAVYQLIESTQTGLVANSPFYVGYPNLRSILSTMLTYDNGGQFNPGTDITWIQQQAANLYIPFQKDPFLLAWETRNMIGDDMPSGVYYLSSRHRPINTASFGNMGLNVMPSLVNTGAMLVVDSEFFASAITLAGGGSIQSA